MNAKYLEGIKEGRQTLERLQADDITIDTAFLRDQIVNLQTFRDRLARCAHSSTNIDLVDGEIAFWRNQMNKHVTIT